EDWQQIGQGLAGAGAGLNDHVLPGQDGRNRRQLHRRWSRDPVSLECGQERRIYFQSCCSERAGFHRRLLASLHWSLVDSCKIVLSESHLTQLLLKPSRSRIPEKFRQFGTGVLGGWGFGPDRGRGARGGPLGLFLG